jgi:carbamoyltransferase
MNYNILGVTLGHNSSACVLSNGEIVYFLEEERFSKYKHDSNPFMVLLDVLNNFKIDEVVLAGINNTNEIYPYSQETSFSSLIQKYYPKLKITSFSNFHHLCHLSHTFFNSNFKNALGIVIDGGGSYYKGKGIEMDSIYQCSSSKGFTHIYSNYFNNNIKIEKNYGLNVASTYSVITSYLKFKQREEGKTMGLSSYGNYNPNFPSFFKGNKTDTNYMGETTFRLGKRRTYTNLPITSINKNNFTQYEKDLAWKIQNDTQQIVGDYIEKYTKKTNLKHVCCAGGYFLNCVANYYLTKRFPEISFYFEPISSDAGTSIGAAKLAWHQKTNDTTIRPQKTLYYGPKYSKKELLEGIKKYT